jgi:hypothetical protein
MSRKKHKGHEKKAVNESNRISLAFMELAEDKTFQKLPEDQKMSLVKEALSIGDEVASWTVAEYGMRDPRKIAAKMGIKKLWFIAVSMRSFCEK